MTCYDCKQKVGCERLFSELVHAGNIGVKLEKSLKIIYINCKIRK